MFYLWQNCCYLKGVPVFFRGEHFNKAVIDDFRLVVEKDIIV